MEPLTEKQQKILKYTETRLRENNPPSQREIAGHFGLSQNSVYQLVSYLKKKGYLAHERRDLPPEVGGSAVCRFHLFFH